MYAADSFRRTFATLALGAGLLGLLYLLWQVSGVLLLIFAGILVSILLGGLSAQVRRRTPLGHTASVLTTVVVLLATLTGLGWAVGPGLVAQFQRLGEKIPEGLAAIRQLLGTYPWADVMPAEAPTFETLMASGLDVMSGLTSVVSTTFGTLANIGVVLIIGFYLALNPSLYRKGIIYLLPKAKRARGRQVLTTLIQGLGWWLVGRFSAMLVVGLLTTIGLWIAGVPLALSLGLIAALFSFIPFIGPLFSVIPILLVAYLEEPSLAVYALLICAIVQVVESNLITPIIQRYAVAIPPAILIIGQVIMGVLFGFVGVMFATPVALTLIILVQMLYVEDVLGDDVRVLGTHAEDEDDTPPVAPRTASASLASQA